MVFINKKQGETNMKNPITALLAGALLMIATSAMAIPINGNISFFGALGLIGPNAPVVAANATGVHFTSGFVYGGKTGDYSSVSDFTPVIFSDFAFSPNLIPSKVVGLWSVTSGLKSYSFDLLSVTASNVPSNTLALNGSGILHITGFDDTPGFWSLTAQDGVIGDLTFSAASTTVPEPGTMVLLGFGMLGLAIYGKRRMNKES
jgi:hypothetical protein